MKNKKIENGRQANANISSLTCVCAPSFGVRVTKVKAAMRGYASGFTGWEGSRMYLPSSVLHAPGCNAVHVTDPAGQGGRGAGGGSWVRGVLGFCARGHGLAGGLD